MGVNRWPLVAVAVLVATPAAVPAREPRALDAVRTWAVYYGAVPGVAPALARFDLVVLDPQRHPPLDVVKHRGARVLMYLSLGEVNVHHRLYPTVAAEPWVLGRNAHWPDARRLDVRDPAWERWVLDRLAPAALARPGVDGLFLDTVDSALGLEREDPERFGGMGEAVGRVVRALRTAYPDAVLVMNGGLPLLEGLGDALDGLAAESVWTDFDFTARRYRRRPDADASARARALAAAVERGWPVLTLEYAPPADRAWVAELLRRAREQRFVPYVSTIRLDRVFTHTVPWPPPARPPRAPVPGDR